MCCWTTRSPGSSSCARSTGRSWTSARAAARPGSRLAVALPEREVTLLEAERRKADFLERWTGELPNLRVIWGRAEEQGRSNHKSRSRRRWRSRRSQRSGACRSSRVGGGVVLWVGPTAEPERVARVAERLGGELGEAPTGLPRPAQGRPDAARLSRAGRGWRRSGRWRRRRSRTPCTRAAGADGPVAAAGDLEPPRSACCSSPARLALLVEDADHEAAA